jgi:hypothetical protein
LIGFTLWIAPAVPDLFGRDVNSKVPWWRLPIRLFVASFFASFLARDSYWFDFAVMFTAFMAAGILFRQSVWDSDSDELRGMRRRLLSVVLLAVPLFAAEGSVLPSMEGELTTLEIPNALPGLLVLSYVLGLSLRLSREASRQPSMRAPGVVALYLPAIPLVVILLALETAVLPYLQQPFAENALPWILILLVVCWAGFASLRARTRGTVARREWEGTVDSVTRSSPAMGLWLALYLFGYPLLAELAFEVDAFGRQLDGMAVFFLTLAINLFYLLVVWFTISFGLDRVAVWAKRDALKNLRGAMTGLLRGLPLLLVFTAFFVMTAEVWQVAAEVRTVPLLGLLGLLLGLTLAFVVVTSWKEINEQSEFKGWKDVEDAADPKNELRNGAAPGTVKRLWQTSADLRGSDPPDSPLKGKERINAIAVLGVYQLFLFVPVMLAAGLLFWCIGHLAVTPEMAADWIYGDRSSAADADKLRALSFFSDPWTRVAAILAVFSLLYIAVAVLSDDDQRKEFLSGADAGLRERLAVRVLYQATYVPDGTGEPGRLRRFGRRARTHLRRVADQARSAA